MTRMRPLWMSAAGADTPFSYDAAEDRALIDALWQTEGVIRGLRVVQRAAGADFSVDVVTGDAVIAGDDTAGQGKYFCRSTAVENRVTPGAPGTGTRIHRVVAQLKDKLANGIWTGYEWDAVVLQDTGTGTPAIPASAIHLALVSIATGQTSVTDANITNGATAAALGPRPVQSSQGAALLGNGFAAFSAYTDFASGTWPSLAFTVPQSGTVLVTVSANVQSNPGSTTSTALVSWRGSGGGITSGVAAATAEPRSVASRGSGRTYGSRRVMVPGLTPGASVSLTPVYYVTSTSGDGNTQLAYGQLIVEPVA